MSIINTCSKVSVSKTKEYTCLSKEDLVNLYNDYLKSIKSNNIPYTNKYSKLKLYNKLKKVLSLPEREWWRYSFIRSPQLKMKLRYIPFKPLNSHNKWGAMSMSDIDTIFLQLTQDLIRDGNLYYGTIMANHFELFPKEIKKLQRLINKGLQVGMIFNTSSDVNKGKHWVSMCIDKDTLHYFDSFGYQPNIKIKNFINSNFSDKKLIINRKELQKRNGPCGMYAIEFLLLKYKCNTCPPDLIGNDELVIKKKEKYFMNGLYSL